MYGPLSFTISDRSLYFKSLLQETNPDFQLIAGFAQSYLSKGLLKINSNPSLLNMDRFQKGLKILKSGIEQERATEREYFSRLFSTPTGQKLKDAIEKHNGCKVDDILKGNDFSNYPQFINIINQLYTGIDNYEHTLTYEQNRQKQLQTSLKNLQQMLEQEEITKAHKRKKKITPAEAAAIAERKIKNFYLEQHTFAHNSKFAKYFKNVAQTIDYLLAETITEAGQQIIHDPQLLALIKQQIHNQNLNYIELRKIIANHLISQAPFITEKIFDAIKNNQQYNPQAIIDKFKQDITNQTFEFISPNLTLQSPWFAARRGLLERTDQGTEIRREQLAEIILQHLDDIIDILQNYDENSIKNADPAIQIVYDVLNSEIVDKRFLGPYTSVQMELQQAQQLRNQIKADKKLAKKSVAMQTQVEREVQQLGQRKRRLTIMLRERLNAEIDARLQSNPSLFTRDELTGRIEQIITPDIFEVTGPEYSEIAHAITTRLLFQLDIAHPGRINNKADAYTISVGLDTHRLSQASQKTISNNMMSEIEHIQSGIQESATKIFSECFEGIMRDLDREEGRSFNLGHGYEAFTQANKKLIGALLRSMPNDANSTSKNNLERLRQIAHFARENIVVTDTMKTYSDYDPDIGFLGGSLGANLEDQLNNFSELFSRMGNSQLDAFSDIEKEWLIIALVNCSSVSLGYSNLNPLEKYLSVLIGFAMFDEGSAEVELIAKKMNQENPLSAQIMHVYRLNGLYFPGSYVLSRIYEHLTEIGADTANSKITDGAKILAKGNYSDIPTTPGLSMSDRWEKTWEAAYKKTTIKFAFLSNLIDVINDLQNAFNQPTP